MGIAPELIDDANANFPSFYGGAYINAEKKLVIQVTSLDESVIEYFENIIGLTNVIFDEVKYSYAELKQAHADIVNKMDATSTDPIIANIAGVGISYKDNAVALYLITSDSDAKSSSIKNEVQEKVSTFDSIKIIATSAKDTPTAVVEPGTTIKNGAYSRSVGFWAEDEDGNLVIEPTQARVVRDIYRWYIDGASILGIQKKLAEQSIPSPTGKEQWSKRTIDKLLTNEKYIGTVLLSDSVTEGQTFQMKDSHPPIITEDVFHAAQ